MSVRVAASADAPLIHRIMRTAFAEYENVLEPPSGGTRESVAEVEAVLARGGGVVAWMGEEAVGAARWERRGDALYVGRVAVLPACRRVGVATAMMQALEGEARRQGLDVMEVCVRGSLPSNRKLYESLGYTVTGVVPHPGGPDTVVTLRKRLL